MNKIYELTGTFAVKYVMGLFYMTKIFKQTYRSHFVIINNRSYTLREYSVYPDEKFLADLDIVIPYEISLIFDDQHRPRDQFSKDLVGYIESFSQTGCMYNPNGLTYIVWNIDSFYQKYKELEKTKYLKNLTKVVFYQSGIPPAKGTLVPSIDYVEIYDSFGNLVIQSDTTQRILTPGLPRFPNPNDLISLDTYSVYGNRYSLIGYIPTDDQMENKILTWPTPVDLVFHDRSMPDSGFEQPQSETNRIDISLIGNVRFERKLDHKRCFISKSMMPKEFANNQHMQLMMNLYVNNSNDNIFVLRSSKLIANRFILSSDFKFIVID